MGENYSNCLRSERVVARRPERGQASPFPGVVIIRARIKISSFHIYENNCAAGMSRECASMSARAAGFVSRCAQESWFPNSTFAEQCYSARARSRAAVKY